MNFERLLTLALILSKHDVTYRQLRTDGRPLPQDPDPSWNGFTIARWEGDTLVAHVIRGPSR